jgi:hypothetical protein
MKGWRTTVSLKILFDVHVPQEFASSSRLSPPCCPASGTTPSTTAATGNTGYEKRSLPTIRAYPVVPEGHSLPHSLRRHSTSASNQGMSILLRLLDPSRLDISYNARVFRIFRVFLAASNSTLGLGLPKSSSGHCYYSPSDSLERRGLELEPQASAPPVP